MKGRVILDEQNQSIGIRGGVFDVTERQRLEREMRERQKIVSVGELAAGVAHNFNNMLMAVMGLLDVQSTPEEGTTLLMLLSAQPAEPLES